MLSSGSDIQEFDKLDTPGKGLELVARGWHLFTGLAALPNPTQGLVRVLCLGGARVSVGLPLPVGCR